MKAFAVVYLNDNAFSGVEPIEVLAVFTDYDSALEFAENEFCRPERAIYETTLNPEMT